MSISNLGTSPGQQHRIPFLSLSLSLLWWQVQEKLPGDVALEMIDLSRPSLFTHTYLVAIDDSSLFLFVSSLSRYLSSRFLRVAPSILRRESSFSCSIKFSVRRRREPKGNLGRVHGPRGANPGAVRLLFERRGRTVATEIRRSTRDVTCNVSA